MEGYTWADLENTEREQSEPALLYVNLYNTYQAYGGPEEGGWWYTVGDPFSSVLCDTEEKAKELFSCMSDKYASDKSVMVELAANFATSFPEYRPRYE